jgi:transcriptional regulator with XRE-family HTH domain
MKSFGEFLRSLREEQDIPQRKVAEALDMDVSVLSRIESSNRFPKKNISQIISRLSVLFKRPEEELWDYYMSDEIASILVDCKNVDDVIVKAKKKAHYLKEKNMVQSAIKF